MSMSLLAILSLIGGVIILVLAAIAGRLVYKVIQLNKKRARQMADIEAASQAAQVQQRSHNNKSIQILAMALHKNELSLTEASMRIAYLLDQLEVHDSVKEEFSAFYQLRERTNHIPILQEWKALSDKEQRVFDKERLTHENTYFEFVMDAAKRIQGREF